MDEEQETQPVEYVRLDDPDGRVAMIACGRCGAIYTPEGKGTGPDAVAKVRDAAANCSLCSSRRADPETCEARHSEIRARRIAAATRVTDLGQCFSDDGDTFYASTEDACDSGETGVFGARFMPYRIDFGDLVSTVIEGHHDDAGEDELDGLDELAIAVDVFNTNQTKGSYEMDEKTWQAIPQQRTFAMIKPDATARGVEAAMMADMEAAGFRIVESRRVRLERSQAEWLYREHSARDHFADLVDYTVSGDVVMLLIEGDGDNVPAEFRRLMGATDHTKAEPGTLRARYAVGYRENSIHGSDSPRAAIDEIIYFMS